MGPMARPAYTGPDQDTSRAKPVTQRMPTSRPPPPAAEPPPRLLPCPCCSERVEAKPIVRHGVRCTLCAYVIWARDVD